MARATTVHVCQGCGYRSPKWLGRCPDCGAWGSLAEEAVEKASPAAKKGGLGRRVPASEVRVLAEVADEQVLRFSSGLDLVDRVLGGGVVTGAASLLAGEPGIGKSTLLLQMAHALAREGVSVLYISAEESPRQLRLRAERLGCLDAVEPGDDAEASAGQAGTGQADEGEVLVLGETRLEEILATIEAGAPERARLGVVLIDSIQAIRSAELAGPPGSIGQVRHSADRLVDLCKERQIALFLVGHVTKEGSIAGPKSLEHLVDTVLTFEGEGISEYRMLRAQKNRFGATGEVAMFEMHDSGLQEVADPSRVLLALRRENRPGSAVLASLHGSRPLLVEVQALVHPTSFPSPRRMAVGLDSNRVTLLVAVLGRFGNLSLAERDLFLNVVGGLQVKEPAADLAIAAAVLSAERELTLPRSTAFFGEVGLLGEVRPVSRTETRLKEIAQLGFRRAFTPRLDGARVPSGLEVVEIEDLDELPARLFGQR